MDPCLILWTTNQKNKILIRPKNGEDVSKFDDFWTKSIASARTKIWEKIERANKQTYEMYKTFRKMFRFAFRKKKQNIFYYEPCFLLMACWRRLHLQFRHRWMSGRTSKSSNGRKVARMARNLTIFGPNRSRRRELNFEKFSNERAKEQTNDLYKNFSKYFRKFSAGPPKTPEGPIWIIVLDAKCARNGKCTVAGL